MSRAGIGLLVLGALLLVLMLLLAALAGIAACHPTSRHGCSGRRCRSARFRW